MLSFKSIAVFATLALGAISSVVAAPALPAALSAVPAVPAANGLAARCDTCRPVAAILVDLKAQVSPLVVQLSAVTKVNATVEVVTPVVVDLKAKITACIVELQALVGADVNVILATADGSARITVEALAYILGDLLCFIFTALYVVLCAGGEGLLCLLAGVGELLGTLLCVVISLCGSILVGLCAAVVVQLTAIVHILVALNINVIINVLAIVV